MTFTAGGGPAERAPPAPTSPLDDGNRSVPTGWPVSASKVSGATKRCAVWVMTTRTVAPSVIRRRASDAADRKSTRLNSSHLVISYAVFCLKKKKNSQKTTRTVTEIATNILALLQSGDD